MLTIRLEILAASLLITILAFPATQQQFPQNTPQYPARQEANNAHHGYMYAPNQQAAQLSQYPTTVAPGPDPKPSNVLLNDPDFQMLARSLQTARGTFGYSNPLNPKELPPCSFDGRSVTIDHLRISPDSLAQIAHLAQAFGTNPDWKKLRLADMKSALDNQMHPTHQYAARSIGL
uniref:Uncharacterized protein n=1 Tax=Caenorhabditis japonica TaxID=281687 RepID=A0A8R1HM43_CAEJA